jgi:hypothetical protein
LRPRARRRLRILRAGSGIRDGEKKRDHEICTRAAIETHSNFSSYAGFKARQKVQPRHALSAYELTTKNFRAVVNAPGPTLEAF